MSKIGNGERPTMEVVAVLAGVSKITVSRALRGSDLVRPEVRERITQIANQIGYRMNVAARSLRTRQSRTIAVVLDDIAHESHAHADPLLLLLISGLLEALTPINYGTLLTTNEHFLSSGTVGADGVIIVGQGENAHRLREMARLNLPMIAWGEPVPGVNVAVIGSDNQLGGKIAAEHLIARGRSRFLFLGDTRHPEVAARLAGFREALASSEAMLVSIVTSPFTLEGAVAAVRTALDQDIVFDGIFAASDHIAAGACDALIESGLAVPGDVAIVGFDDSPVASVRRPAITTIRQDGVAAGRALGTAIVEMVEGKASEFSRALPVELVVRETS